MMGLDSLLSIYVFGRSAMDVLGFPKVESLLPKWLIPLIMLSEGCSRCYIWLLCLGWKFSLEKKD